MDPRKPFILTRERVDMGNGGESEGVIIILYSSFVNWAAVIGRKEVLYDLHMSEEAVCHSGPSGSVYKNLIGSNESLEDLFGSATAEEDCK